MTDTNLLFELLNEIDPDEELDEVVQQEREATLRVTDKETRRKERREKRRNDCGNWSYWYNPHTGKQTGFAFKCELFRECPSCLERRADDEYHWLRDAVMAKSLITVKADSKEATKLLRGVDKTLYVRYPQEDGIDVLIVQDDAGVDGSTIDLAWITAQDWETLVNTPEGRNKSGTVHFPASDDDMSEFTLITTKQFTTSANRYQTLKAMKRAEEKTSEMDPQTPDEVVKALNKRVSIATGLLRKEGFTVQVYDKRLKLIHSKVNWQVSDNSGRIFRVNTDINTENPTSPGSTQVKQAIYQP